MTAYQIAQAAGAKRGRPVGHQSVANILNGKGCTLDTAFWIVKAFPAVTFTALHAEAYPKQTRS
jgi:hypothetical protein